MEKKEANKNRTFMAYTTKGGRLNLLKFDGCCLECMHEVDEILSKLQKYVDIKNH
jgi:hypothetical protein